MNRRYGAPYGVLLRAMRTGVENSRRDANFTEPELDGAAPTALASVGNVPEGHPPQQHYCSRRGAALSRQPWIHYYTP